METTRPRVTGSFDIGRIETLDYDRAVPVCNTYEIFERGARLYGQNPAIVQAISGDVDDACRIVTYSELLAAIRRAANLFHEWGIGSDDAVALLLPSLPETHYALWGAEVAGCACPINFMLSVERIAELLVQARAKVLVALGPHPDFDIWRKAERLAEMVDGLEVFSVGESPSSRSFEAALNEQPAELRFERVLSRETVAAYYHTGGTTGAPKLARHTHGNQVHTSWFAGMFYDLGEGDCILNGFPLFHVAGAFVYGSAAFCAGSSILLAPPLGMRDPAFLRHYWRFVDRCRVSHLAAVPTVIGTLLDTPAGEADLSSVKALYTGGSPLPTELANSFERSYSIPVRNILGMTECAGLVSIEPLGAPRTANSCGLRLPFTEVFAVSRAEGNCDPSRTCLPDEPGVIVVRGPHVSPGYTNPQLNAGMFEADGLLLSGDIGHVDALGRVFITGRAKDVIIRGAHNIDPNMIEEVFSAHADVQSCAAVGAPDRHSGEVPVIFLALRPNATSSPADILSFAASRISEPAALPKRVTILPALPTTAIGKIYRPALRILAIEQVFSEALALLDPAESGTSFRVKAMETPSGLRAEIGIPRALDPRPAQEKVIEALGRFAIPLDWISI